MGKSRLVFVLLAFFSHYNVDNTNWKKPRWCARDSNPGPLDGRCRRNHGAMVGALHLYLCLSISILPPSFFISLTFSFSLSFVLPISLSFFTSFSSFFSSFGICPYDSCSFSLSLSLSLSLFCHPLSRHCIFFSVSLPQPDRRRRRQRVQDQMMRGDDERTSLSSSWVEAVWPVKSWQMSIKVVQKCFN